MPVVKNADLPVEQMYPLVQRRTLIGKHLGSEHITMGEVTLQPGGEIPLHTHSIEDCILIRQGTGEIHIDGQIHELQAPMTALVKPGQKHKVLNTGEEPLRIIFGFPSTNVDRKLID